MREVKYILASTASELQKLVQEEINKQGSADGPPVSFNGMLVQKVVW